MKKISLAVGLSVATMSLLGPTLPALADDAGTTTTTDSTTTETAPLTYKEQAEAMIAAAPGTEEEKAQARAIMAALPDDALERAEAFKEKLGLDHATAWEEIADEVIDPTDHVCAATPLTTWINNSTKDWWYWTRFYYAMTPIRDLPVWNAVLYGKESSSNTFGYNGEYTDLLNHQMRGLRGFWDVPSDIELVPMHSRSIYENPERIAEIFRVVYGAADTEFTRSQARVLGGLAINLPGFEGGNHPALSFNAFALDPSDQPALLDLGVTKRIVMGDGVMAGMAAIGLDPKVAPRSILAHEYGHHVQFAKNLFDSPLTGPEATRRTELMADGFATYFMVHSLGDALNAKRTLDNQKSFYNVGDCSFTSNSHHGTPNQRARSSAWAVDVVENAANQGLPAKMGGTRFGKEFDKVLDDLVAPDAN